MGESAYNPEVAARVLGASHDRLPSVALSGRGDVLLAGGHTPHPWSVRVELEGPTSARTKIAVCGQRVADVTIHATHSEDLFSEAQEVASAIVWSALRAAMLREAMAE